MRKLYLVQLVGGLLIVAYGLAVVPVLPYSLLDVVLTPEQLRDDVRTGEMLSTLTLALRHEMILATAFGVFVVATSVIGMKEDCRKCGDEKTYPHC